MSDLAQRQCIPCRGGVPPLTRDQIAPLLAQLGSGWQLLERTTERHGSVLYFSRAYKLRDFAEAMAFANAIAELAQEQQHHPDLHVSWGRVVVEIWTHKIGGLTESDAIFAAKCDARYVPFSAPK